MNELKLKNGINSKAGTPHELGFFGKFLPIWVALCIFAGIGNQRGN